MCKHEVYSIFSKHKGRNELENTPEKKNITFLKLLFTLFLNNLNVSCALAGLILRHCLINFLNLYLSDRCNKGCNRMFVFSSSFNVDYNKDNQTFCFQLIINYNKSNVFDYLLDLQFEFPLLELPDIGIILVTS